MKMEQLALEKQKALMEHEFWITQLNSNCGGESAAVTQTQGSQLPDFHNDPTQTLSLTGYNIPTTSNNSSLLGTSSLHGGFGFDNFNFDLPTQTLNTNCSFHSISAKRRMLIRVGNGNYLTKL